jgi:hypothetical protein
LAVLGSQRKVSDNDRNEMSSNHVDFGTQPRGSAQPCCTPRKLMPCLYAEVVAGAAGSNVVRHEEAEAVHNFLSKYDLRTLRYRIRLYELTSPNTVSFSKTSSHCDNIFHARNTYSAASITIACGRSNKATASTFSEYWYTAVCSGARATTTIPWYAKELKAAAFDTLNRSFRLRISLHPNPRSSERRNLLLQRGLAGFLHRGFITRSTVRMKTVRMWVVSEGPCENVHFVKENSKSVFTRRGCWS